MTSIAPISPVIIVLPAYTPGPFQLGNGWLRNVKPYPPPPRKSKLPRHIPPQQTPAFDRKALHERVFRQLHNTRQQRNDLINSVHQR
jgi:hypothetical protein